MPKQNCGAPREHDVQTEAAEVILRSVAPELVDAEVYGM